MVHHDESTEVQYENVPLTMYVLTSYAQTHGLRVEGVISTESVAKEWTRKKNVTTQGSPAPRKYGYLAFHVADDIDDIDVEMKEREATLTARLKLSQIMALGPDVLEALAEMGVSVADTKTV